MTVAHRAHSPDLSCITRLDDHRWFCGWCGSTGHNLRCNRHQRQVRLQEQMIEELLITMIMISFFFFLQFNYKTKPSPFLSDKVERTKPSIAGHGGDQGKLWRPAEGDRDGDIPAERQSHGKRAGRRVHHHPAGRAPRERVIALRP